MPTETTQTIYPSSVLQTNACEKNRAYCANRMRRTVFTPDELARCFDQMQWRGEVICIFTQHYEALLRSQ